nr:MAK10-like protein [Tanacetum cinerariifolium]
MFMEIIRKNNDSSDKEPEEEGSTITEEVDAFITEKVLKFNSFFESLGLAPQSSDTEVACTRGDDREVMFMEIIRKNNDSSDKEPEEEGSTITEEVGVEYFDTFLTRSELAYHKYLMYGPIPSIFLRNPIIKKGCPSNIKIPCSIRHVHMEKAYIDRNSPLNIMNRMLYNWIMRRKLDPRDYKKVTWKTGPRPNSVVMEGSGNLFLLLIDSKGHKGSPSQPLKLLETCGFIFLLVPGSSGGGGKSLPSGFKAFGRLVIELRVWREKGVQCKVHSNSILGQG